MADLGHTPRTTPTDKPIRFSCGSPSGVYVREMPPCFICTACGCFYLPTKGGVCPNRVMEVLKERVL